ncbi:MAG: hypothetical protein HGA85_09205, partial [Nanoarchaeota archaeon]|nr:hypothetical protein [Nanoarchaeota archaeon]
MRRQFLLLLLLLVLVATASATKLTYEGWLYNGKYLEFGDSNYKILITDKGSSLLLLDGSSSISVEKGDCTEEGYQKVCFNASSFDRDLEEYKGYVYVYLLSPDIEIERTLSQNIFSIGETAKFTVYLRNIGEADAEYVKFEEALPENLVITTTKKAWQAGSSAVWEGKIDDGEEVELTYTVKSIGSVDRYNKASAKFFDGTEDREVFSSAIRLYAPSILDISLSSGKEDFEIGEDIALNITLTNNADEEIKVDSIYFYIPAAFKVETKVSSSAGVYSWSGNLESNESQTFQFTLHGTKVGLHFLSLEGAYTYDNAKITFSGEKIGFVLHDEGTELETSLDSNNIFYANQKVLFVARLLNKNAHIPLGNISTVTETDATRIESTQFGYLRENSSLSIISTEFRAPDVAKETKYLIRINVSYEVEGYEKNDSFEETLIVKPMDRLKIVTDLKSGSYPEDASIPVKVSLVNSMPDTVKGVDFRISLPDELVAKGVTSAFTDVSGTKEILSFTLLPVTVTQETRYSVIMTATYLLDGDDYLIEEKKEITIYPRVPKVSVTKTTKDDTTVILPIGSSIIYINGISNPLDVPAKIINSRT